MHQAGNPLQSQFASWIPARLPATKRRRKKELKTNDKQTEKEDKKGALGPTQARRPGKERIISPLPTSSCEK